jgi:hypothetical protein
MKTIRKFALSTLAAAMLVGVGGCAGMSAQDKSTAIGAGVGAVGGFPWTKSVFAPHPQCRAMIAMSVWTCAATSGEVTEVNARYQTPPGGEQERNGRAHCIARSSTRKRVDGQISPEGWRRVWAKKA